MSEDEHAMQTDGENMNVDSDQLDLLDRFSRSRPLSCDRVYIVGLERTRASVVTKEFQAVQKAQTIDEIRDALDDAHEALMDLDIFEEVHISIEPDREGRPGMCSAVVRAKEKQRFHVKGGTYVQTNEGKLELQATVRNTLGFAEQIQFSAERGSKGSNEFSVALIKPRLTLLAGVPLQSDTRISQLFRNFEASSFVQRTRGSAVSLSTDDLRHSVTYELGWRTITDPSRRASKEVQHHLGHALKSSVVYTFRHSHWPTGYVSRGGHAWRSTSEVAGLGFGNGMLRFIKQRLQGFLTVPLLDTSAYLSFSADVGVMLPLGAGNFQRQTPISDRFFLGGAGSLRGFHTNSVGAVSPRRTQRSQGGEDAQRRHDYLGGDLYTSLSAALNFPLPLEAAAKVGIHGHVFADAGNTALLTGIGNPALRVQDSVHKFLQGFRMSVGVGLVWPIQQAGNLELNFCKVISMQDTDRPKHGIQVGFSPQFL